MKIINNFTDFINEAKTPPKDIVISLLSKNVERGATLPEQNSAFSKAKMIIQQNGFTRKNFSMFSDEILDLVFGVKPNNENKNIVTIDGFDFKKLIYNKLGEILVDDEYDILDDYLKSTTFVVNDFENEKPIRVFTGKYDIISREWLDCDLSDNNRCFFYGESDIKGAVQIIGSFSLEDFTYGYNEYSRKPDLNMKNTNYKYILYLKPYNK